MNPGINGLRFCKVYRYSNGIPVSTTYFQRYTGMNMSRPLKLYKLNYIPVYSVMQSDGNSLKIDTFWEAITSEPMIAS